MMHEVKVIRRDGHLYLEMPDNINLDGDSWYIVPQQAKNDYLLIPKVENPYLKATPGELYEGDEWYSINGGENNE